MMADCQAGERLAREGAADGRPAVAGDRRAHAYRMLQRLQGADVTVHQERCLSVRNRNVVCTRCADACTSGCIALEDGLVVVAQDRCVGCGTCATACPTCALEARCPADAALTRACAEALEARGDGRVQIACARAAASAAGGSVGARPAEDAVRVVCLGRVDESLLVALAAQGAADIDLVCGDCAACPQEAGLATARAVCASARALLEAWGCATRIALAEATADPACPAVTVSAAADARGADRAGTGDGSAPDGRNASDDQNAPDGQADAEGPGAPPRLHVMADGTMPHFMPDRRERLLDALAELGDPADARVEGRLWGRVVIDVETCTSCRLCTVFCPTGALACTGQTGQEGFGVEHRPADCVRCGACEQVCPRNALRLEDDVDARALLDGEAAFIPMRPVRVQKGGAHSMMNAMRDLLGFKDLYER